MAQFYAWYSTPLHPATYTTPSSPAAPRTHARSRSEASSAPSPVDPPPPRSSTASTASSARDGSSSSAGLTPQSSRTTQDPPPAHDRHKLRKKRRGRANPFRHARSSSADSALPPDDPGSPAADGAATPREPPGLSARLLHRLHVSDPARRGPRDAGHRPRDPCPQPQPHTHTHSHPCPCQHVSPARAREQATGPDRVSSPRAQRPTPHSTGTPSSRPNSTSAADPPRRLPSASTSTSTSTTTSASTRSTTDDADPDADAGALTTSTSASTHRSADAGPCCPSCCPSQRAQPGPLAHPDPVPPSAASTQAPTPAAATQPSRARALGNPDATVDSAAAAPHSAPFRPHLSPAPHHHNNHNQQNPHQHQHQHQHQQHHRRASRPPRRRAILAAHDTILPFLPPPGALELPPAEQRKHAHMHSDADPSRAARLHGLHTRPESLSSATASLGARTMASSDPSASRETIATRPFAPRNGRTYLNDPSLAYPLPVDLAELHRQSLRTLLLIQVFGAPACSPSHAARPPARVLEVGCGSGFWSMMCHRYFRDLGHANIAFTGLDVAPLAPGAGVANGGSGTPRDVAKPDPEMNWRFVQHDVRQAPFPFSDGEFDLVMVKDMSLAVTHTTQQRVIDEYLRVLKKGGHLEIWESDHTIRMLRPHAAEASSAPATPAGSSAASASSTDHEEEHRSAAALGAYVMTANTPLSPPLNNYLVEYNSWIMRALEARDISAVPCTLIGPLLLQESEELTDVRSRRLAIPLSEVRWEREGVGGVVTKDGKSYIDTRGRGGGAGTLSAAQAALRRTALEIVVQGVQSLEPVLREVSGKRVDEWEGWIGKMAGDLLGEGGTSWGECLEVGAWWAQKR